MSRPGGAQVPVEGPARGSQQIQVPDHMKFELETPICEALYAFCQHQIEHAQTS